MTNLHDPPRWDLDIDDTVAPELAPGLRDARVQAPDAVQLARMRAVLDLPTQPASRAADGGSGARVLRRMHWAVPALLLLGVAGYLVGHGPRPQHPHASLPRPPAAASEPNQPAQPNPSAVPAPPMAAKQSATPARAERRPQHEPGRAKLANEDSNVAADGGKQDPAAELALLKRARAAAQSEPRLALALVAQHVARFPDGMFVQEREVIAIEALLASGERDQAMARAVRFHARFPGSVHARRVEQLLTDPVQSDTRAPR